MLYRDAARLARSLDMAEIRRAFERDLSIAIGDAARRRVFVHAGVVGVNGGAILIPGKSCSGKTTLVQALVAQGGVYYSDDYAVLDGRGRVFPWAEPLSLRERGPTRASERHTPESLGMASGRKGLPVRLVVLTSFQKGRAFSPREETKAAGTLGLLQHTLPARRRPRAALKALAAAVSGARVISGPRGEARAAARSILAKLNSPQGA